MMHGARICPRCRMRVDERRARGALHCLSCGSPLGTPPPMLSKKAGGGSAGLWIALVVGFLLFVGAGITGAVLWLASDQDDPPAKKRTQAADAPPLETATPAPSAKPPRRRP